MCIVPSFSNSQFMEMQSMLTKIRVGCWIYYTLKRFFLYSSRILVVISIFGFILFNFFANQWCSLAMILRYFKFVMLSGNVALGNNIGVAGGIAPQKVVPPLVEILISICHCVGAILRRAFLLEPVID